MSTAFVERKSINTGQFSVVLCSVVSGQSTMKTEQERAGLNYCNFLPAELIKTIMESYTSVL